MNKERENILAIIPARGGSKRIPRKNIKPFLEKPVIGYAIENAVKSKLFSEVMVSTDDKEIADVSIIFGAKVPFFRSTKNSDDNATLADVMREVLHEYSEKGKIFDSFCCIYPVTPLLNYESLKEAYQLMRNGDFDTVIPVISYSHPIQRALKVNDENKLEMVNKRFINTRTQDLPKRYYDAGQFFFMRTEAFLSKGLIFTDNTHGLEIPETNAQDIDNESDWKSAEIKYKILHSL